MTKLDLLRHVRVSCGAAGDDLNFLRLTGSEELGRLSCFQVDLVSTNNTLNPGNLLGQDISIAVQLPEGGERELNGIITAFRIVAPGDRSVNRMARYEAIVRPRLWLLTRASHCRFFHDKTVPDIITDILHDYSVDLSNKCSATYPVREHCAQYRETDFDFVSRLMEHEGIYYYFEHRDGKHTLVLADAGDVHAPLKHYESIAYMPGNEGAVAKECIYEWASGAELQTGKYEVNDYDFERPSSSNQQGLLSRATRPTVYDSPQYTMQEHLTGHTQSSDGDRYAKVGIEIRQTRNDSIAGRANVRALQPGYLFKLKEHPDSAQNRNYLVVGVTYEINSDDYVSSLSASSERPFFDCRFVVMRKENHFRSERLTPQPVVAGPQTAVVVGPDGEEIHTDKYGRIKVQFHWEQFAPPASADARMKRCWVRVTQSWAGKTWGTFFLPRIGQEVVVDFIEGDPDRPLVTGCVYNASMMPPYELPANAALSTLKSNSTKGGGGFNELRFDDTKGQEQVFVHAQNEHDTWVNGSKLTNVGGKCHLKIKGDQLTKVTGDRHDTVEGNQTTLIKGDVGLTVDGKVVDKTTGDYTIDTDGTLILTGKTVIIQADSKIVLQAGGGVIEITGGKVSIVGMPINLNSGGGPAGLAIPLPSSPTEPDDADDGKQKLK